MSKIRLGVAAAAAILCTNLAGAATFDFKQSFGGYHNSIYFDTGEGWGVTVTAQGGSNKVSWVDDGLGNGSNGFNYLLAVNEQLTFTFDAAVTVGEITLSADFSPGAVDINWDGNTISGLDSPKDGAFTPGVNQTHLLGFTTTEFTVVGVDNFALIEALGDVELAVTEVPVPAAVWLFGSALLGLAGLGRKQR